MKEELQIDFLNDHLRYQRKSHRGKQELIAKALGSSRGIKHVYDLTCGMAEDAFFLAQIGFQVTAIERSVTVYDILSKAIVRAKEQAPKEEVLNRFTIIFGDSKDFLRSQNFLNADKSDSAIYLDPMFPEKKKTALPRKEMQIFRRLVGDDPDAAELLAAAMQSGVGRVVVKRPIKAKVLGPGVMHSFEGKTVRYDLYVPMSPDIGP